MSDYYSSGTDPTAVKQIAERFGFCLVKGIFSAAQIEGLELDLARAASTFNGNFPDLYSCQSLRWIMLDSRVREIAKALLGKTLVYYRETSIVYEAAPGPATLKPYTEFHCDARGTRKSLLANWDPVGRRIYPAYRFASYFRNYRDFSGGLKVAVGSHLYQHDFFRAYDKIAHVKKLPVATQWLGGDHGLQLPIPPFELFNIPSMPGDMVIFNLRTFHAAGALRLRSRPAFATLPLIENGIQNAVANLCLPRPEKSRNAIFFDYGALSEEVDLYSKWRALQTPWNKSAVPTVDRNPAEDIIIRNDKVIVGMALKLAATLGLPPYGDKPISTLQDIRTEVQVDLRDFLSLCREYREFSPYHPLFDQTTFARVEGNDSLNAGMEVVHDVVARSMALKEEELRMRGKLVRSPETPPVIG